MWKNIVEPNGPQMTIWRMRIACCIPKAATRTQNIYEFSTATIFARTHLEMHLQRDDNPTNVTHVTRRSVSEAPQTYYLGLQCAPP